MTPSPSPWLGIEESDDRQTIIHPQCGDPQAGRSGSKP